MGLSALLSTQILDSTATGRAVLTGADAPSIRTVLGLELEVTKTWNNAGTVFTGLKLDVTDTASDASSAVLDMQVGGSSKFKVSKTGQITALAGGTTWLFQSDVSTWSVSTAGVAGTPRASIKSEGFQSPGDGYFAFSNGTNGNGTLDVRMYRDASNTLALRNGTASQTSRVYGTYTDASNYERGFLQADTNGFTIGHEAIGTGTKRPTRILGVSLTGSEAISALNVVQTWNTTGTPAAFQMTITDTASGTNSLFADWYQGATRRFAVDKNGVIQCQGFNMSNTSGGFGQPNVNWWSQNGLNILTTGYLSWNNDLLIRRDAANTLAQRNGASAQTSRIYNTFTDSSNYEFARLAWESNQFVIGNDYLGTGAARAVALVGGQTGTQGVVKASTGGVLIGAQLNLSNSSNASASTSQIVLYTPAAGQLRITNATSDGFDRMFLGPATASFPMLKRNATAINFRLGDDTADAPITAASVQVSDEVYGGSWNGSLQVPTKNALWDKIETISGGGGGVSAAFVIAMSVAL